MNKNLISTTMVSSSDQFRKFCLLFSPSKMTELLDARLCVLKILKITELLPLKGFLTKALYLHLVLFEAVHLLTGTNL